MMMRNFALLFALLFSFCSFAQNTVGLLSYKPTQSYDGYNLFYPHNQPNVFLMDNCGEIVHVWTDSAQYRPGNTAYLMPNGNLIKTKRPANVSMDAIWAGGGGATIEIRDWDNNLLWDFTMNDSQYRLHHDIAPMGNGHILAIAWEAKSKAEALQAGRDTSKMATDQMWPDWIFEIDPSTDSIVWEWHSWDHLIQDFDPTKDNYGVVGDHPGRIDVNYDVQNGHPDWHHGNSLDFNEETSQILFSVPYFDEIWIIDRTTTTAQAAGSTGGFSNRGGDLMYRWGNPTAYRAGDSTDQTLFFQHDAHWVVDFLTPNHPDYGKIAVFNNQIAPNYSVANTLIQPWDMYNWSYEMQNGKYLPEDVDKTFAHPVPTKMWSTGLSSVQHLPNGNTLLCSGRFGYSFELTPDKEIVWEYITPIRGGASATQGDSLTINQNLTFRMNRYPSNFPAFAGKDLSPKGWIELNPDSTYCDRLVPTFELMDENAYKIYPNPASDFLTVEWDGMQYAKVDIFDARGVQVASEMGNGGRVFMDVSELKAGLYVVRIDGRYGKRVLVTD